jgi:O-antigen ligase
MSKGEKSEYFRHVFAINFFWCIFSNLFQRIQNQREILRFLIPIFNFCKKKFFALISTFFRLWLQMRRKRLKKKRKIVFYECLLEFDYATIKGFA